MIPIASCLKEAVLEVVLFSFLTHHKFWFLVINLLTAPFHDVVISSLKFLLYLKVLYNYLQIF